MAHCLFAVEHFDSKFVELITKLSMCNEFFTNRWLPNIFVDMIATNGRDKLKRFHLFFYLKDLVSSLSITGKEINSLLHLAMFGQLIPQYFPRFKDKL